MLLLATAGAFVDADRAGAADPSMDAFVSDLLTRMTLEEKIGQLNLLSTGFGSNSPQLRISACILVRCAIILEPTSNARWQIFGRESWSASMFSLGEFLKN